MTLFTTDSSQEIILPCNEVQLLGLFHLPIQARGLIIFVHGSGSSRLSSRNQYVAKRLQQKKFATLLFDLLTADEEMIDDQTAEYRFNIPMLADRLLTVTHWVQQQSQFHSLSRGYFGASTGAGAALIAAGQEPSLVQAVVSRGGR